MYENSLDSATSAEDQGTRRLSVSLGHSRTAEVSSLMESSRNLITEWDQAHIIRETSERTACEENVMGGYGKPMVGNQKVSD